MALAGLVFLSASDIKAATPAPDLKPRPGWTVELLLQPPQLRHPSVVCSAPDGRIFVAEDPMDISAPAQAAEGRILCLHPNGTLTVFAEKLHAVFGMQYLQGKLYVLHNPKFSVFRDDNGVGRDRDDLIESTNPNPWALDWNDHVPANFKLAMDGFFYIAVGDKGILGAVGRDGKRVDLPGGGILRMRPDGTGLEVFSTGMRNILDVAINEDDDVFTYDNTDEHDWMGRLTHMVDGGFYGYPHDFIPQRPYTLWMMHDFGAGAATGAFAYTDDALPEAYRGNLFIADFGKRSVTRVDLDRAGATYRMNVSEELFPSPPDDFRPVGIAPSADGRSILICDWAHRDSKEDIAVGRLWRLTHTAATNALPRPTWWLPLSMGRSSDASDESLVAGLNHPALSVRMTAQRELVRRKSFSVVDDQLKNSNTPERALIHSVWAADALDHGVRSRARIITLAASGSRPVQRQALRQLGTRAATEAQEVALSLLHSDDVPTRFAAATALGRLGSSPSAAGLIQALGDKDFFTHYAVFTSLNRLARRSPEVWPLLVTALANDNDAIAEGATLAMRETYQIELLRALQKALLSTASPMSTRLKAASILSSLHRQLPAWKGEWGAYHPALAPAPIKNTEWDGTPIVVESLRSLLDDANETLRVAAVVGLNQAASQERAPWLRTRLAVEKNDSVRAALFSSLAELGIPEDAPLFATLLAAPIADKAITAALLKGAVATKDERGMAAVIKFADGTVKSSPELRALSLELLGGVDSSPVAGMLQTIALSGAEDESLRVIALRGLSRNPKAGPSMADVRKLIGSTNLSVRRQAIRTSAALKDREAVEEWLRVAPVADLRAAVTEAFLKLPDPRGLPFYLEALASSNPVTRDEARKALEPIRSALLPAFESITPPPTAAVISELRRVYSKDAKALESKLFDGPKAPEISDYAAYALKVAGDPVRGQKLFSDESGVACIKCHKMGDAGNSVGPELTTIGTQFPRAVLIEHVLEPSKVVREGYQAYNIELKDGESLTALIKGETSDAVTVVDTAGVTRTIPKANIESRTKGSLSLMPEGLQAGLTLDQFADLIAFLESRKTQSRQP